MLTYEEIVTLLQKEYGAIKTRDLARLDNLKCGNDIVKFNDEFNRIGQGCQDILSEAAQIFKNVHLVKPESLRTTLQGMSTV